MRSKKIKCIIIDDEFDIRERLESLLSKIKGIEIISKEGIPEKAIKNEAFDFLIKPVDIEELSQTIERYRRKQHDNKNLTQNYHVFDCLSEREKEVLNLLLQGLTSKEIAKKLFVSKATIDTHRRNILDKTGMKSTAELMALQ